jgi:hypothetical protein
MPQSSGIRASGAIPETSERASVLSALDEVVAVSDTFEGRRRPRFEPVSDTTA